MFYDSEKNVSFDIKFYAQKPFKKESYKAIVCTTIIRNLVYSN